MVSIDLQLNLLGAGIVALGAIAAWQSFKLRGIYRSPSSWVGMGVFLLSGGRQSYSLWRLGHNIAEARAKGYMIDHLSTEQWLAGVVWSYAIAIGFVVWLHLKHLELKKLGI